MAADEDFHLGLIKLYAHQWNPFWSHQPPEAAAFGAVTRDPSYLYHYLLAIVYRGLSHLVHGEISQVIILRCINIALFSSGLVILRRTFIKFTTFGRARIQVVLAMMLLIPMVSQVAGQINYDNLFFLVFSVTLYRLLLFCSELNRKKVSAIGTFWLFALFVFGSLVKYSFLPIVLAAVIFLLWQISKIGWVEFYQAWLACLKQLKLWQRLLLGAGIVFLSILWLQRYGLNMLWYHTPTPECDQVIDMKSCFAYGPWRRNYVFVGLRDPHLDTNILRYGWSWVGHVFYSSYYVLNGPFSNYQVGSVLLLPFALVQTLAAISLAFVVLTFARLWRQPITKLLLLLCFCYMGALFTLNYIDFLHVGQRVAVQGRYFIPMFFPLLLITSVAWGNIIRAPKHRTVLASIVLLLLLQGGGFLTYVLKTDASWYWQTSPMTTANHYMRNVVKPLVWEKSTIEP